MNKMQTATLRALAAIFACATADQSFAALGWENWTTVYDRSPITGYTTWTSNGTIWDSGTFHRTDDQRDPPYHPNFDSGNNGANGTGRGGAGPNSPKNGKQATAKSNNNSPNNPCGDTPVSQHPVILSTGEKLVQEQDFVSPKLYGLSMSRNYRNFTATHGLFGSYWL